MNILQTPQGIEALQKLGVRVPEDFDRIQRAPFPQAQKMLADLKDQVKAAFKKLAFELHPDRTGGDEAKTALFKALVQAREAFENIEVRPAAPPPMMIYHSPQVYTGTSGATTTSTTYYASPFGGSATTVGPAWRVVRMRPS